MREGIFIFLVALVLLGLTLLRYRKQLSGLIEVGKVLKEVKNNVGDNRIGGQLAGTQLVNCSKCGVWVPQNKAVKRGAGGGYSCKECATVKAR